MLEDQLEDIIGKAARGLGQSLDQWGITSSELATLSDEQLEEIAPPLQLDINKLKELNKPFSHTYLPQGLHCLTSPFGELGVNFFALHIDDQCLLFDTGTETEMLDAIAPTEVFITHEHSDHIAGVDQLNPQETPVTTPATMQAGETRTFGEITIQALDSSGHYVPSLAYFITGLENPVCIMGDAIFRRSMGGCKTPENYHRALTNVRHILQQLPPETILCVGHGPNTTVAEEINENPFL